MNIASMLGLDQSVAVQFTPQSTGTAEHDQDEHDFGPGSSDLGDTPGLKKSKNNFCLICKEFTSKGRRDQGPRRHILHKHISLPSFMCPHCDYASKFHKHHIKKHIRDTHPGKHENVVVRECDEELKKWYKDCFGIEGTNARPGPRTRREKTEFETKCATRHSPTDSPYAHGMNSSLLSTSRNILNSAHLAPSSSNSNLFGTPLISNRFSSNILQNTFLTPSTGTSSSGSFNSSLSTTSSMDLSLNPFLNSCFITPPQNSPLGSIFSPSQFYYLMAQFLKSNNEVAPQILNASDTPESSPGTTKDDKKDPSKPGFFVDNLLS